MLAVLALLSALTAGCRLTQPGTPIGLAGTNDRPVKGGTFALSLAEPSGIDPWSVHDPAGLQVEGTIFDSLTRVDPSDPQRVLASAATTWTASQGGTVWTFKLDPDDRFHEGTLVTASDFVYAWNRLAKPRAALPLTTSPQYSPNSSLLSAVLGYSAAHSGSALSMSGVKSLDDETLQVTLSKPFADFDYTVASPALAPVPMKYVEAGIDYMGRKVTFADMPVGNGPFKMSAPWAHRAEIKVVRNDDYYGHKAYLDAVDFKLQLTPTAAYARFKSGQLDFASVPAGQIATAVALWGESPDGYKADPKHQVLLGTENALDALVFNSKDKVLADTNVRKAISLAIDRSALSQGAYAGTAVAADNVVPPHMVGYQTGGWADSRFDPVAARAALAAAGFPGGKGLPALTVVCDNEPMRQSAAALLQSDLRSIGVNATVEPHDAAGLSSLVGSGKYQVALVGLKPDGWIVDTYLSDLFGSQSSDNASGYSSVVFDQGMAAASAVLGRTTRVALYQELNTRVQATDPVAPLVFGRHHVVAAGRVHDLMVDPQGMLDFDYAWLTKTPGTL